MTHLPPAPSPSGTLLPMSVSYTVKCVCKFLLASAIGRNCDLFKKTWLQKRRGGGIMAHRCIILGQELGTVKPMKTPLQPFPKAVHYLAKQACGPRRSFMYA